MVFSQELAYMVTTVAAAARYQGMDFAINLLCEMILRGKVSEPEPADWFGSLLNPILYGFYSSPKYLYV
jgi:hypothetical protein